MRQPILTPRQAEQPGRFMSQPDGPVRNASRSHGQANLRYPPIQTYSGHLLAYYKGFTGVLGLGWPLYQIL